MEFINEKTFLLVVQIALKIPSECQIGMPCHAAITMSNGKWSPYDPEKQTPSASISMLMNSMLQSLPSMPVNYGVAKLLTKNHPMNSYPMISNYTWFLFPSLTTPESKADVIQMAEKQHFFFLDHFELSGKSFHPTS